MYVFGSHTEETPGEGARALFAPGELSRLLAFALIMAAFGVLAVGLGLPSAGVVLFIPPVALAVFLMLMSPIFCIGVLLFVQQNDVILEMTGIQELNKGLAVVAIISVLVNRLKRDHFRSTMAAGAPVFVTLFALVLLSALSYLHADNPSIVTQETIRFVNLCALVGIVAFGVTNLRDVQLVLLAYVVAMLPAAIVTLIDFVIGDPMFSRYYTEDMPLATFEGQARSRGTTLESVPMAATMLLGGVTVAMVMALFAERWRPFYAAAGLIGATAILTTLTRSATLAMALSVLIVLWWARKEHYFGRLLVALTVVGAIAIAVAPSTVWTKFTIAASSSFADRTVERRLGYQIIGVDLMSKHPLVGVGAGNYIVHYAKDDYNFVPGRYEEPRPLHNIYLQYGAELGLTGLIVFLAMLGSALFMGHQATRSQDSRLRGVSEAVLLSLLAMAIQFVFLSSNAVPHFWVGVGLAIAVYRLVLEERRSA